MNAPVFVVISPNSEIICVTYSLDEVRSVVRDWMSPETEFRVTLSDPDGFRADVVPVNGDIRDSLEVELWYPGGEPFAGAYNIGKDSNLIESLEKSLASSNVSPIQPNL